MVMWLSSARGASRGPGQVSAGAAVFRGWTRRRVVGMAGSSLAGAALIACAGGPGAGDVAPASQVKGPVTIRWSTWGDEKNPFNTDGVPKGLAIFNQKFPNIKVEPEVQVGGPDSWSPKLTTEWIAGSGVDVTGHCCDVSLGFARQGFLTNMEPFLKRDAKDVPTADYVDWLMKLFHSPENGQFALPMYTGTIALMFNRRRFQEKGVALPDDTWDWNKYREVALKIAEPDNKRWARADVGASSMYRRMHQIGANVVDPKDDTKAVFNTDKALQAFEFERDGMHKDRSVIQIGGPKAPPETAPASQTQYVQINSGYIALWEGGAFTLTRYITMLNDDVDWDIAPLPKGTAGRFTLATNDGWSMSKVGKNQEAAWQLVRFLQSDEWTDIATRVAGQQSARRSHQQKWLNSIKDANPKLANKNLRPFTDAIEKGYARPIEFWRKDTDSKKLYTDAYNAAVRDGTAEIGVAMRAAVDQINQLNKA
jgi:multiple sugar transport system substrate-binding protein